MKNLTTALYSKLTGSALSTAVGGRVFKGVAPEGTEYPYVVYSMISDVPDYTFTETLEDVTIQFDIFSNASSSGEIEDLFGNLKSLYDFCSMTVTGGSLLYMRRSFASLYVEDVTTPTGTEAVWHYSIDYEIKMKRT